MQLLHPSFLKNSACVYLSCVLFQLISLPISLNISIACFIYLFLHCFNSLKSSVFRSTIAEKSTAISVLPFPVFLYFFPIFPSHFYILSNLVYPSGAGSFPWSFSSNFVYGIFLRYPPSPLLFVSYNQIP